MYGESGGNSISEPAIGTSPVPPWKLGVPPIQDRGNV